MHLCLFWRFCNLNSRSLRHELLHLRKADANSAADPTLRDRLDRLKLKYAKRLSMKSFSHVSFTQSISSKKSEHGKPMWKKTTEFELCDVSWAASLFARCETYIWSCLLNLHALNEWMSKWQKLVKGHCPFITVTDGYHSPVWCF